MRAVSRAEGLEAAAYPVLGPSAFREIRANPPDAILIDLSELPSYGRAMAVLLRERKSTRKIPLVFLKGDPEKIARVREVLPDAVFATWPRVAPAIEQAIEGAPQEQPAPQAVRRCPGAKAAHLRRLRGGAAEAPANIRRILGPLPKGVRLAGEGWRRRSDSALQSDRPPHWGEGFRCWRREMRRGRTLWVCWPKRTSSEPCDLTLTSIREMASPYNLVDSKICAMDETWSATAISRRRSPRRQV